MIWVTLLKACGGSSSPNADARSIKATLTRRSTGPRSGAGKKRASRNAYRHGLTF
jgi:hypothetical protein